MHKEKKMAERNEGKRAGSSSVWVPEALVIARIKSGWHKVMRGMMGPCQVINTWG